MNYRIITYSLESENKRKYRGKLLVTIPGVSDLFWEKNI